MIKLAYAILLSTIAISLFPPGANAGQERAEWLAGAIGNLVRLEAGYYDSGKTLPSALVRADSLFDILVENFQAAEAYVRGDGGGQVAGIVDLVEVLQAPQPNDPAGRIVAALRGSELVNSKVKPLLDGYGAAFLLNLEGRRELRLRLGITEVLSAAGIPVTLKQLGLNRADSMTVKKIAEAAAQGSADSRGSQAYLFYSTMLDLDDLGGRFGGTQNETDLADRLMADRAFLSIEDRLKELPPMTVCFFGDSQTDNRHWSSPAHYPKIIEEIFRRINPNVKIFNAGIGGDDSGEGLERIEPDVLVHEPDICFVMFGGNDSAFWGRDHSTVSPDQYEANMDEIVRHLIDKDCRSVLICYPAIPSPDFGGQSAAVLAEMNRRQEKIRNEYSTGWIDLAGLFATRDPKRMFAVDLIHYSPEAHHLLAGIVLRQLVEMN